MIIRNIKIKLKIFFFGLELYDLLYIYMHIHIILYMHIYTCKKININLFMTNHSMTNRKELGKLCIYLSNIYPVCFSSSQLLFPRQFVASRAIAFVLYNGSSYALIVSHTSSRAHVHHANLIYTT